MRPAAAVLALALVGLAGLAGCTRTAAPTVSIVVYPTADGDVAARIGTCRAGRLERIEVSVDPSDDDIEQDDPIWRAIETGDDGPRLAEGGHLDVVLGTAPDGMHDRLPLSGPVPDDVEVEVRATVAGRSNGLSFWRSDLQRGTFTSSAGLPRTEAQVADTLRRLCGD